MNQTQRKFSSALMAEVALEAIKGINTISEIVQQHELHPMRVTQWKKVFLTHSIDIFEVDQKHDIN